MFERFTENARKSVFFARYEASQFGCPEIEAEHLLLGILRTDNDLALRLFPSPAAVESIRARIEQRPRIRKKISLSTDLPLTHECRRIMSHAAEEADRVKQKSVGTLHLLLAIAREESLVGAKLLSENGVTIVRLREEAGRPVPTVRTKTPSPDSGSTVSYRDLTAAAHEGGLGPLIGRERELEQALQVLSRQGRNNVALIGETGVGRTTILEAVAERIALGSVPAQLADRRVIAIDAAGLVFSGPPGRVSRHVEELIAGLGRPHPLLCVEGLFDLAAAGSGWSAIEAAHVFESHLTRGSVQCVATGTRDGLRQTLEKAPLLARRFEVVEVHPPSEAEAVDILRGVKRRYEEFHRVLFAEDAVEAAVRASGRFLRNRELPDRALDLLDEAGARAKLRGESEPREAVETRHRIRQLAHLMENAIANHEFDVARRHSDEERKEREHLARLLEARPPALPAERAVTGADIEEVIAERIGASVDFVRSALRERESGAVERISQQLAAQVSSGSREWLPLLAAYLYRCSPEDAGNLARAIRKAKGIEE